MGRLQYVDDRCGLSEIAIVQIARAIGTTAEIRWVTALSQPVMFGVRRPVILLPARLRDAPADIRQAVAAHELWHVRRHDWLWLIGEELIRAALWFQPVIWWLVGCVRASREEVVDGRCARNFVTQFTQPCASRRAIFHQSWSAPHNCLLVHRFR